MKIKMIFGVFPVTLPLLVFFEITFNFMTGLIYVNLKSDCTKLENFLNNDNKNYYNDCCSDPGIECDNDGYITYIGL